MSAKNDQKAPVGVPLIKRKSAADDCLADLHDQRHDNGQQLIKCKVTAISYAAQTRTWRRNADRGSPDELSVNTAAGEPWAGDRRRAA
jgi:hypothetical protein